MNKEALGLIPFFLPYGYEIASPRQLSLRRDGREGNAWWSSVIAAACANFQGVSSRSGASGSGGSGGGSDSGGGGGGASGGRDSSGSGGSGSGGGGGSGGSGGRDSGGRSSGGGGGSGGVASGGGGGGSSKPLFEGAAQLIQRGIITAPSSCVA